MGTAGGMRRPQVPHILDSLVKVSSCAEEHYQEYVCTGDRLRVNRADRGRQGRTYTLVVHAEVPLGGRTPPNG